MNKNPIKKQRLPMTPDLLFKMKKVWSKEPSKFDNIMLWAASCVCYFDFLCSGEVTIPSEAAYDKAVHLNMEDIAVDNVANPSTVKVVIRASKTDQFRKGVDIHLGRTQNELCPVEAILAYIACSGKQSVYFFIFQDGRLLTKDRFISYVRLVLAEAGTDSSSYSRHSFRIGAATTAERKGVSSEKIKTLGR